MNGCFVVFDLDDTLYLERDFVMSGFQAVERWAEQRLGIQNFAESCRQLFERGERQRVFDRALAELGVTAHPATVTRLVQVYRGHAPNISLAPDADRALTRYRGHLGLISDGPAETQRAKLKALGLEERLNHIVLTGELGAAAGKPSPIPFIEMELMTGARDRNLVYVADNPTKDFLAPRQRGWRTVMIERPERVHLAPPPSAAHVADHRITTLDKLDQFLSGDLLDFTV